MLWFSKFNLFLGGGGSQNSLGLLYEFFFKDKTLIVYLDSVIIAWKMTY